MLPLSLAKRSPEAGATTFYKILLSVIDSITEYVIVYSELADDASRSLGTPVFSPLT